MERHLMLLKLFSAGVVAWLSNKLGILFPLLAVFCILMIVDYISGMSASKYEAINHPGDPSYGWSSRKGAKGILKKVAYMCVIAVAIALDYLVAILANHIGIDVKGSTFFGLLVTIWYMLNELLSIAENAGRADAKVPDWLLRYIAVLKDKIDKEGDRDA